jgi:hypothetical protein
MLTCSDKKVWQCTGAMPPFMTFMESKTICQPIRQKGDSSANYPEIIKDRAK